MFLSKAMRKLASWASVSSEDAIRRRSSGTVFFLLFFSLPVWVLVSSSLPFLRGCYRADGTLLAAGGGASRGGAEPWRGAPEHRLHLRGFSHSRVASVLEAKTGRHLGSLSRVTFPLTTGSRPHGCCPPCLHPEAELFCAASIKHAFFY